MYRIEWDIPKRKVYRNQRDGGSIYYVGPIIKNNENWVSKWHVIILYGHIDPYSISSLVQMSLYNLSTWHLIISPHVTKLFVHMTYDHWSTRHYTIHRHCTNTSGPSVNPNVVYVAPSGQYIHEHLQWI